VKILVQVPNGFSDEEEIKLREYVLSSPLGKSNEMIFTKLPFESHPTSLPFLSVSMVGPTW